MTRLELANQLIENQSAFHFAFIPVIVWCAWRDSRLLPIGLRRHGSTRQIELKSSREFYVSRFISLVEPGRTRTCDGRGPHAGSPRGVLLSFRKRTVLIPLTF